MINGSLCNTGERQEKQEETANGYKVSFWDDDVLKLYKQLHDSVYTKIILYVLLFGIWINILVKLLKYFSVNTTFQRKQKWSRTLPTTDRHCFHPFVCSICIYINM